MDTLFFTITEELPGIDDDEVLKIAYNTKCVLITQDKDFGNSFFEKDKHTKVLSYFDFQGLVLIQKQNCV